MAGPLSIGSISPHAVERVAERLGPKAVPVLMAKLAVAAGSLPAGSSAALVMAKLPEMKGVAWSDVSNGDLVVAVVRNRVVKSVFLRRSSQSLGPDAFGVDRVFWADGVKAAAGLAA